MIGLAVLFLAAFQPVESGSPPEVREIEIHGATVFEREAMLAMMRLKPGDPLRREPAAIAQGLTKRYQIAGYPAARVSASFDEPSGRLTLDVEEGRLSEIVVEGLEGAASRQAIRVSGLQTGKVLREGDVWAGIARVEEASEEAVKADGDTPYTVESGPDGARLVLHLRRDPARVLLRTWGPRAAGRYNRVDGLSLGLATEVTLTDASSYNHLRLLARASYGFSSEKVRYTLGAERPFGPRQLFVVGYQYHDLTHTDGAALRYGLEELPGGTINTEKQFADFFRIVGHEAYAFARIDPRFQLGLTFRSDGYTSLPVVTNTDEENPPIEEGRMRSFIGTARFVSRGSFFVTRRSERESYQFPSLFQTTAFKPVRWRAEATYEISRPGLGSDFDFTRFIGRVRLHQPVGSRFAFDGAVYGGATTGEPPLPKHFFLGGLGTLRGFEKKQFTGKNMVLTIAEWSWLPPGRFAPALIPFYDGGSLWGGDQEGSGWKHDAGLGLRWPQAASTVFARLDAALPINPEPGQARKVKWNLRIQVPF